MAGFFRFDRGHRFASTAMVNHFYWYIFDEEFGPFFLKFCSYSPYNAKVCLNGHEWLKRQLAKELRPKFAGLLGIAPNGLSPGSLSYDLRRLRLHGLI